MTLSTMTEDFNKSLNTMSDVQIEKFAQCVLDTLKNNSSIFICGNGGSGANANLFATAMSKIVIDSFPISVISLNSSMAIITHIAESFDYINVFSMQIASLAHNSDLLIAISGSGNSPNILEAVATAKKLGMYTIGLTGMGGGRLSSIVDFPIVVDSDNMEQIETIHTVIIHAISIWMAVKVAE